MKRTVARYLLVVVLALSVSSVEAHEPTPVPQSIADLIDIRSALNEYRTDVDLLTSAVSALLDIDDITSKGRMYRGICLVEVGRRAMRAGKPLLAIYAFASISTSDSVYLPPRLKNTIKLSRRSIRIMGRINYMTTLQTTKSNDAYEWALGKMREQIPDMNDAKRREKAERVLLLEEPTTSVARHDNLMLIRHWAPKGSIAHERMKAAVAGIPFNADWIGTNTSVLQDMAERALDVRDWSRLERINRRMLLTNKRGTAEYLNIISLYVQGEFHKCAAAVTDFVNHPGSDVKSNVRLWALVYQRRSYSALAKQYKAEGKLWWRQGMIASAIQTATRIKNGWPNTFWGKRHAKWLERNPLP